MQLDYETFRAMPWEERVTAFNALFPGEKAELVRTHIARWLEAHRGELTAAQIEVVEGGDRPRHAGVLRAVEERRVDGPVKVFETQSAALLSREQMREAFTMHW